MTTTTLNKNAVTIISAGTSNAAGGTTLGTPVDLRTAQGGILTVKVSNGSTGPTTAMSVSVLIAHNDGSTPAAAIPGTDWKTLWTFSGLTSNSGVVEQSISIDPAIMHLNVYAFGNAGQAVSVEAFLSKITSVGSV